MAAIILANAHVLMDGFDLSGDMNAIALDYGAEIKDKTTFGNTTRRKLAGLKTLAFSHQGFWNGGANAVDDVLFSRVGSQVVMTVAPETIAAGDRAFINNVILGDYNPGAAIGEVFQFSVTGEAGDNFIRGTVEFNGAAVGTGSGNSTGRQLGALTAAQRMYAALHVTAKSGTPTLDVTVKSDDNSGFTTPVTRGTFAQKTNIGAEWLVINGPQTDGWWRISYTIAGTTPTFDFMVTLGIL
jgi:hypothetical protein